MLGKRFVPYMEKFAFPVAASLIAIAVLLMLGSGETATNTQCTPVNGHIDAVVVPKEFCGSPFGLCTRGKMIGGVQGEFNFTVTSFTPSPDQSIPYVALYTGRIVIDTMDGDVLFGTEAGGFNTDPVDDGEFGELLTITGGTGNLKNASGHIAVYGTVNLATGVGSSDYKGELCRGE